MLPDVKSAKGFLGKNRSFTGLEGTAIRAQGLLSLRQHRILYMTMLFAIMFVNMHAYTGSNCVRELDSRFIMSIINQL